MIGVLMLLSALGVIYFLPTTIGGPIFIMLLLGFLMGPSSDSHFES